LNFALEKELQLLVEQNIREIFGLDLVKSEFQLKDLRIDTLAFDNETRSFTIIEYKKDRDYSVIDQGFSYLALLLNNKEAFRLIYVEKINVLKRDDEIDWSQSKIIFASPFFSLYQKKAIEFKDLPIELWEVKRYDNHTIEFNQIQPSERRESIKTISKRNQTMDKVTREIKVYDEEDKMSEFGENTQDIYYKLGNRILDLGDDIVIITRLHYVAFKKNMNNFVRLIPTSFGVRIRLNSNKFKINDPRSIMTLDNRGTKIDLKQDNEVQYVIELIKQACDQS
jgi:predicted transport protein